MDPVETLMTEHRLIERVVALLAPRSAKRESVRESKFISAIVDFFQMYADRVHHGKEESIFFRALEKRQLSPELARLLKDLIAEHEFARNTTRQLAEADARLVAGDSGAAEEVRALVKKLVTLYPYHIGKEEKRFFWPAFAALDAAEQEAVDREFKAFDQQWPVQDKYRQVVEGLETLGRQQ